MLSCSEIARRGYVRFERDHRVHHYLLVVHDNNKNAPSASCRLGRRGYFFVPGDEKKVGVRRPTSPALLLPPSPPLAPYLLPREARYRSRPPPHKDWMLRARPRAEKCGEATSVRRSLDGSALSIAKKERKGNFYLWAKIRRGSKPTWESRRIFRPACQMHDWLFLFRLETFIFEH